ncbi:hypothetical protein [Neptunomonas sp.]|uniref:hypothetical protein n=1 Tax=Neptunomonas sp. TaxID=1971898 RepID=UPI0025EB7E49|nr:hypothetical protein [Neptunomonas sp.]
MSNDSFNKNLTSKQKIRSDKWLQRLMKAGIPLAIVSVASLWLGHLLANPAFGKLFIVTLPLALLVGFTYNIRYVMLAVREQRKAASNE